MSNFVLFFGLIIKNIFLSFLLFFWVNLKGHWMRSIEPAGDKFSFKPPIYDINGPDLYIPMMAFSTYLVLVSFLGINGIMAIKFVNLLSQY